MVGLGDALSRLDIAWGLYPASLLRNDDGCVTVSERCGNPCCQSVAVTRFPPSALRRLGPHRSPSPPHARSRSLKSIMRMVTSKRTSMRPMRPARPVTPYFASPGCEARCEEGMDFAWTQTSGSAAVSWIKLCSELKCWLRSKSPPSPPTSLSNKSFFASFRAWMRSSIVPAVTMR